MRWMVLSIVTATMRIASFTRIPGTYVAGTLLAIRQVGSIMGVVRGLSF
jgi:hypothetical protein